MTSSSILALIHNVALLLALAVIFDTTVQFWKISENKFRQILMGFLLGGMGIVLMNTPWIYGEGLIFDTRSILLSLSGLFFGTIPALIAMTITAVYRFSQGGAYITGISVIIVTSLLGIGWRKVQKKELVEIKWWQLYLFGIITHIIMLLLMFTQPIEIAVPLLSKISLPIIIIYPGATLLLGLLMQNRLRREKAVDEIEKNRSGLKSMVDILQSPAEDSHSFLDFALAEVVKLTNSEIGLILFYSEETKIFTLNSFTRGAADYTGNLPFEMDKKPGSDVVWYRVVAKRAPIIDNDFLKNHINRSNFPGLHTKIHKLLIVPIFSQSEIVAVVGVANKKNDYDELDVAQLSLTMEMVWKTTERKNVIKALSVSEENYRQLFNQAADGIFITTSKGDYLDVNDSGCLMLGYTREEMQENFAEIFKNIYPSFDPNLDTQELKIGQKTITQQRLLTKSDNLIDVEILTRVLSDGRVQKVVRNITERINTEQEVIQTQKELQRLLHTSDNSRKVLLSVIEDQKEIEEALRKSEKSYRSLFENITQGFALHRIILNEDGQPVDYEFLAANPAYENLTGLKASVIIGKTIKELFPAFDNSRIKIYGSVALTGKPTRYEDLSTTIDKYFDVTAFCPEPGYFAVVISDITERKKYELEIHNFNLILENRVKDRTAELESANHELESFSYSISHDLRAPLRSIHGFSQIILEDYSENLDSEVIHYFDLIRKNATLMGNLVDDLLNFSRLGRQSINKVKVDPGFIVREVIETLQTEINIRNIKIKALELPECEADPSLLRQIFVNLISNSIKFSRMQTDPEIEIGHDTQVIEEGRTHSYFYVKDNGVGFDMKFYDKLFGVFQRLHRAEDYEGTGVGLAIVERIVKKHGGNIWAESVVGKGTTFYFTLGDPENGK